MIAAAASSAAPSLRKAVAPKVSCDLLTSITLLVALLAAVAPLEISHLLFLLVGAGGYALARALHPSVERRSSREKPARLLRSCAEPSSSSCDAPVPLPSQQQHLQQQPQKQQQQQPQQRRPQKAPSARPPTKIEVRTPSVVPVAAPSFRAVGWESEVQELVCSLRRSPADDAVVAQLVRTVQRAVALPGAKVTGHVVGSVNSGAAFGVAVPDVEIVITMVGEVLENRFPGASAHCRGSPELQKLQKSVLRTCTDRLVSAAAFKFRRSNFKGVDPKVTLLAPASRAGETEAAVPVSLMVNSEDPINLGRILDMWRQKDPKAEALVLLVRRWAKDRGISHTSKGHLSPYAWTMLAIYFLQVSQLKNISADASLADCRAEAQLSVGELFSGFFRFFTIDFDWRQEKVAPRSTQRCLPPPAQQAAASREVIPSIEDPFDPERNLADGMNYQTLLRLHEELRRAHELCASGASLTVLLQPWAPPDTEKAE